MEWIEDKIIVLETTRENWIYQTKDDFVSLNMLSIFTGKSNIEEVCFNGVVWRQDYWSWESLENWTEQTKDDFVSLNMLPIFTGKSNIE